MKKALAILLTVSLLLLLFAGCGNSSATTSEESTAPAAVSEETATEEVVAAEESASAPASAAEADTDPAEPAISTAEIGAEPEFVEASWPLDEEVIFTMFFQYNARDSEESGYSGPQDYPCFEWIHELTNVFIDFDTQSMDAYQEHFNLQMASQDYDDLYLNCFSLYTSGGDGAYEDEVWIDLKDLIYTYCPNYCAVMDEYDGMKKAAMTDSGLMMSFMKVQESCVKNGFATRGDWLDELGLDVPTTLDEWYETALAMDNAYDVLYPFATLPPSCAFYADTTFLVAEDGTVSYKYYDNDDFYAWLETGIKWYEAGLLNVDIILGSFEGMGIDTNKVDGWSAVGDTAIWGSEQRFIVYDDTYGYDAVYEAIPLPTGNGNDIAYASGIDEPYNAMMNISTACKEPELACQWVDWFYSEEGTILCNFGMEGTNYCYNEDGEMRYTDEYVEATQTGMQMHQPFAGTTPGNYCYVYRAAPEEMQAQTSKPKALEAKALWNTDVDMTTGRYPTFATVATEDSDAYGKIYSDIETYVEEYESKVLAGEYDLAATWDEYNENLRNMGVEEMIGYKQVAYDAYLIR